METLLMSFLFAATNNFMMTQFGNYNTGDEHALSDESHKTCTDLVSIWAKGPKIAYFRKIFKSVSPFNVTMVTNPELRDLLMNNGQNKVGVRVDVYKDAPWEGDTFGRERTFTRCTKVSVLTYRCLCVSESGPCSVFVSVTVRDPSVMVDVGSLQLCHIAMTPVS